MSDIDFVLIKKKSLTGVVALASRSFFLQLVAFGATFLLTIFLQPAIFGIFYVVSAIISFLGYFSDIGLAAALIQKKEELSSDDLGTTFTIQQLMVGTIVVVAFIFSAPIARFYNLDHAGLVLLRVLILSFFVSSLKTIPSVLLERKLEFHKLVIPNILETLGFYITAVLLAWYGWGITSFTWAAAVRAGVGLVAMYIISPWQMKLGISQPVAKRLLKFGLPFQLNSFLALVKDDLLTIFLGKALPYAEVGYIGWAKKWADVPLRLIMDSVIRVTFPAFSRLQESKEFLGKAIEKTLFGLSLTIFPISVGLLFFVKPLIEIIPRYGKWEPALMSFYLFAIGASLSSLGTPLTNALNAVGKIKITLWLMVLWTSLTWILTVSLIPLFGFNGVAIALLVVNISLAVVVVLVKRLALFSFWESVRIPIVGVVLQSIVYAGLLSVLPHTAAWYIMIGLVGVILYVFVVWRLERERIVRFIDIFQGKS